MYIYSCSVTVAGLKRKRERDAPAEVADILLKFMQHSDEVESKRMLIEAEREERRREEA